MSDDAKIIAALIAGVLGLLGTIYATLVNYRSRIQQDQFRARTEEDLARIKSKADMDVTSLRTTTDQKIAALRTDAEKEMAGFRASTDQKLARLNAELQAERDDRLAHRESEKIVSRFRDPLLHAAYDLQSRIFNILKRKFLQVYYTSGAPREREYAVENTVFLLAQFLGWTELIRQEIQFLDLGIDKETRELRRLQDGLYTQLQTDKFGSGFRLFAGEQRAVGELMIERTTDASRCIGFASFLTGRDPAVDRWLDPLRDDVKQMAVDLSPFRDRLMTIQHALIDLLKFLDPGDVYFPKDKRTKI